MQQQIGLFKLSLLGAYFLLMIRFCFARFQLALLFALISPWETSGAVKSGEFGLNYLRNFSSLLRFLPTLRKIFLLLS
jgi:hypothetical protein